MIKLYNSKLLVISILLLAIAVTIAKGQSNNSNIPSTAGCLNISVKVYLEGPYENGLMTTKLTSLLKDIYEFDGSRAPEPKSGIGKMSQGYSVPANAVDVITIELRNNPDDPKDTLSRSKPIQTQHAWLLNNGSIVDFETATNPFISFCTKSVNPVDRYHIRIKHRNHISVMSHINQKIALGTNVQHVDMTNKNNLQGKADSNGIYKIGAKEFGGSDFVMMYVGDINNNDKFDVSDKTIVNGTSIVPLTYDYFTIDVNLDGRFNSKDYDIIYDRQANQSTSF